MSIEIEGTFKRNEVPSKPIQALNMKETNFPVEEMHENISKVGFDGIFAFWPNNHKLY
jgi:hypothetical protein